MKILRTFLLVISSAIAQDDVTLTVRVTEYKDASANDKVTPVTGKTGDLTNGGNVKLKFPTTGGIKVS